MHSNDMTCIEVFQQRHCIDILLIIKKHGEVGFNTIQESLDINTATLQRRLEDLQQKEFIIKEPCINDSRSYKYSVLDRGSEAARMLMEFRAFLEKTAPSVTGTLKKTV